MLNKLVEISVLRFKEYDINKSLSCDLNEDIIVVFSDGMYHIKSGSNTYFNALDKRQNKVNVNLTYAQIKKIGVFLIDELKTKKLNAMTMAFYVDELMCVCGLKQRQIADELTITQGAISNKQRLNYLPFQIQDSLLKGVIKERHARAILQFKNSENFYQQSIEILDKIIKENLNVSNTEFLLNNMLGKVNKNRMILNIAQENDGKLKNPEIQIVIDHVSENLNNVTTEIDKFFPNLNIELKQGIDRDDYVFLVTLKGINTDV